MTPIEASRANTVRLAVRHFQTHYRVTVVHYNKALDIVAVTLLNDANPDAEPFIVTADRFDKWEVIS